MGSSKEGRVRKRERNTVEKRGQSNREVISASGCVSGRK